MVIQATLYCKLKKLNIRAKSPKIRQQTVFAHRRGNRMGW